MIEGYVGKIEFSDDGNLFEYILITRRENQRPGTRLNERGVNCDGFVANFAETE